MKFVNQDVALTDEYVNSVADGLGLQFPEALRRLFADHNGGDPEPYVFNGDCIRTVVSETLPLVSASRRTAVAVYNHLVMEKGLVPQQFSPFAVDSGGDYFFVDCHSAKAAVSFYRTDAYPDSRRGLMRVENSLDEFWNRLSEEGADD